MSIFFFTDKPKVKEEWLSLFVCLAEIKNIQRELAEAEAYEKRLVEAEAAAEFDRLEKIWRKKLEMEKEAEKAERFKSYLLFSLKDRQDECGEKSDEDVKWLATRHSACKPSGKLTIFILIDFL